MTNLGIGVMIGMLGGNEESVRLYKQHVGKRIKGVNLAVDELVFTFADGAGLCVRDEGQSCCEHRYMTTDDDLSYFKNTVLKSLEIKDAPEIEYEDGSHEVQFLKVTTGKGAFTVETHNEHNGYYGGFHLVLREKSE